MNGRLIADFEKRFPSETVIRAKLEQPVSQFSITVLFGPSGCGKTTILRCLAGLERPESGRITFEEEIWFDAGQSTCHPPQQRDIGFSFQDYALFPHLTVADNIAFGLRGTSAERRRTAAEMMQRFQLEGLAARFPHQISGGQQQRVALARVLVRRPRLLLLDEPLSALDATLRDELRTMLRSMLMSFEIPVILVTHDRMEAISLADQVIVMDNGQIQQTGPVNEVFSRPVNSRVADIVGIETVQTGEVVDVKDGLATVNVQGVLFAAVAPKEACRRVHLCIKGEDVTLSKGSPGTQSSRNHLSGTVNWMTPEGPLIRVGLDCGVELTSLITRSACEELELKNGNQVTASIKASSIHLIPLD